MSLEFWEREGRETMARIRRNGPLAGNHLYAFRSLSSSSSASAVASSSASSSSAVASSSSAVASAYTPPSPSSAAPTHGQT